MKKFYLKHHRPGVERISVPQNRLKDITPDTSAVQMFKECNEIEIVRKVIDVFDKKTMKNASFFPAAGHDIPIFFKKEIKIIGIGSYFITYNGNENIIVFSIKSKNYDKDFFESAKLSFNPTTLSSNSVVEIDEDNQILDFPFYTKQDHYHFPIQIICNP